MTASSRLSGQPYVAATTASRTGVAWALFAFRPSKGS